MQLVRVKLFQNYTHHLGMLLLRINTLAKGYSGVSPHLIDYLVDNYNKGIYGEVPIDGSCGASGDLAPLSHLVLGYLGYGKLFDSEINQFVEAEIVLSKYNIPKLILGPKEGLALNNGTTFMATFAAIAMDKMSILFHNSNIIASLTIEALHGTRKAFHPNIHSVKGHPGQKEVAKTILEYLNNSEIGEKYDKNNVQDAYSLRCIPQIHGCILESLKFYKSQIEIEMNSATDNPLIFNDVDTNDVDTDTNSIADNGSFSLSGGNFHGQYLSSAADMLSIQMTTLGNLSERRIERLVNKQSSGFFYLVF